jgi:hypothetical protein
MSSPLKTTILLLLGVLVLILTLWPDLSDSTRHLLAQVAPTSPLPTATPTPTITTTAGPTPTKVKRVVNEIVEPPAGDAVSGNVRIRGTVLVDQFNRFDLHISPASMETWQWLLTSYEIIHDDTLFVLDTKQFPDGFYDLRARAIGDDGNYTESFARGIEIRNANPPTLTPVPNATPTPASPLVTPSPTPDVRSRIPGGQGFYAPDNGTVLRGSVDIVATVNGSSATPFARYELSISPAGREAWTWLYGSQTQAWQSPIYRLDTTQLADGLYDLRLRIVYRDANYSEYFLRNLSVANQGRPQLALSPPAGIDSPHSSATVSGIVPFEGTVPAENLLRWELAWSFANREEWQLLLSDDQPIDNGLLARLDLRQLAGGVYDFRLRIVRQDTNYTDYYVRTLRIVEE